jgi:hypothetical protein
MASPGGQANRVNKSSGALGRAAGWEIKTCPIAAAKISRREKSTEIPEDSGDHRIPDLQAGVTAGSGKLGGCYLEGREENSDKPNYNQILIPGDPPRPLPA